MNFDEVRKNSAINTYIQEADKSLYELGYTEHSFAHIGVVVNRTEYILKCLNHDEHLIDNAKIAAYMHDIGNVVNRENHSQSGALMAFRILDNLGFEAKDISEIISAIGNHNEGNGLPVSPLAAALILADKSDVRRSRVRNNDVSTFDIHDRVNYSVSESKLIVDSTNKEVELILQMDQHYSSVMEYFSIFMQRMLLCQKAALALDLRFKLFINNQQLV